MVSIQTFSCKHLTCLLFGLLGLAPLASASVSLTGIDGTTYSGEIVFTAGQTAFLNTAGGRLVMAKKRFLDAASLAAVEAWEADHVENAALPTKFDEQPQVLKKRMPKRGDLGGVRSAVVMLALLIDKQGGVEEVLVKDASDDRVVEPTCEAMVHWKFAPLTVDAAPRRAVVFVPVQF